MSLLADGRIEQSWVGYPELATVDGEGRVPGSGGTFDLGTFEVKSGCLRATSPSRFRESAGKRDLPAVLGTWRAESVVGASAGSPRSGHGPRGTGRASMRRWRTRASWSAPILA